MADFRDYQPVLFSIYRKLSSQRTSAKYLQIRASGSERFALRMRAGKIQDMQFCSDLSVQTVAGEKKSTWKSASEVTADFAFLNQWESSFERLLAGGKKTADPRPSFSENPKVEELTHGLGHYDPEIAQMIPAVIFHRIFQLLRGVVERGYLVDFKTQWLHGASFADSSPMNFAWVDANGFCFLPQTWIDESVCIYHPERPRLRRYLQSSSWKINQYEDLTPLVDGLEATKDASLLAWSRKNFERIVVLPQAVASLMSALLAALANHKIGLSDVSGFPEAFELVDEPAHALFGLDGLIDNTGKCVKGGPILQNGVFSSLYEKDMGAFSRIIAPVLRGTGEEQVQEMSLSGVLSCFPGKTLVVEQIELRILGSDCFIFMPAGGVLYHRGKCLGHVVAPANAVSWGDFWAHSMPIGNPVRIGGIACCALEAVL